MRVLSDKINTDYKDVGGDRTEEKRLIKGGMKEAFPLHLLIFALIRFLHNKRYYESVKVDVLEVPAGLLLLSLSNLDIIQ